MTDFISVSKRVSFQVININLHLLIHMLLSELLREHVTVSEKEETLGLTEFCF